MFDCTYSLSDLSARFVAEADHARGKVGGGGGGRFHGPSLCLMVSREWEFGPLAHIFRSSRLTNPPDTSYTNVWISLKTRVRWLPKLKIGWEWWATTALGHKSRWTQNECLVDFFPYYRFKYPIQKKNNKQCPSPTQGQWDRQIQKGSVTDF